MDEQSKLSLVAIAMTRGVELDTAWTIVDNLPAGMSLRDASSAVANEAVAASWGGKFA